MISIFASIGHIIVYLIKLYLQIGIATAILTCIMITLVLMIPDYRVNSILCQFVIDLFEKDPNYEPSIFDKFLLLASLCIFTCILWPIIVFHLIDDYRNK